MPCYCEICGRRVEDERLCRKIVIDNTVLTVCPQCYQRLVRQGRAKPYVETLHTIHRESSTEKRWVRTRVSKRMLETMYEIVEDYAERIRRARQRLGWTQQALAQKLRVSENVIKRIEAGRLKPSIELARKMEKLLGIILLEPVVEESTSYSSGEDEYLTIGDIIRLKDEERK
jgi:putative transcription factor